MGDELNRMYTWICPDCGRRYEETDIGQLEVRTQRHKCERGKKLKFICSRCRQETPHFKGLLDHYKAKHPGLLKRYEIKHPASKVTALIYASDANTAIKAQGWHKKDCRVKEIK